MTPASFNAALETIGWGQSTLARKLACDDRLVRRWAKGDAPIPPNVAGWLDMMAALVAANPPPAWRRPPFGKA